jgi:hypothetical protein
MPDHSTVEAVILSLPFTGRWLTQNSPARRVPSHGTDLLASTYAIDFVGVDERNRSAPRRDWRTLLATEPVERYVGYGRSILAPADGTVVVTHDDEPDHQGRRSPLTLIPYALGQPARLRAGVDAVAGNHVVIGLRDRNAFVALVHLRCGSLRVSVGDQVVLGQVLAQCGNSGNSTEPHVHLQAADGPDMANANGLPVSFHPFREWARGASQPILRDSGLPAEGSVVEGLRVS